MKPWEKYAQNQTPQASGGGPWSKFSKQEKKPSSLESAVRNFAEGASFSFSDEIAGGVEAAGRIAGLEGLGGTDIRDTKLSKDGPTLSWDKIKEAYYSARDNTRKDIKKDREVNPGVSATANFVGAVASPINRVASGMSLVKGGATVGGINALGASEADNLGEMAGDVATGAALGAVIGKGVEKAAPYVSTVANKISEKSKSAAELIAARALGAERGSIKKIGAKKLKDAGRYALDNKILTSNTGKSLDRNQAALNAAGQKMDEVYSAVDDAGLSSFNPKEVASQVDDQIGGFYRSPINRGETKQLENTLESIKMRGEKNIPLKDAQVLKEELGKVANWTNKVNITEKERMAREAYGIVSDKIDDATQKGAETLGVDSLLKNLSKAKSDYSAGKTAEEFLTNKFAREQGNKIFGLTDAAWGAGSLSYGGATGDWETAAGVMLAKKGLEKYGPQTAARVFDRLSKTIDLTPKVSEFIIKNPGSLKTIIEKFERNLSKAPKAAERKSSNTDKDFVAGIKGQDRWALNGFTKIVNSGKGDLFNDKSLDKILSSQKGKSLLVKASKNGLNPKAMDKIIKDLEAFKEAN